MPLSRCLAIRIPLFKSFFKYHIANISISVAGTLILKDESYDVVLGVIRRNGGVSFLSTI